MRRSPRPRACRTRRTGTQRIVAANGELDEALRKEMWVEIQTIEYENGGLILPVFNNPLDAISAKVSGLQPHWRRELGFFQFLDVSLEP